MHIFKKIIFTILFASAFSNAQWVVQPSGTTNTLLNLFFVDSNTGYACGIYGITLKTTNDGINWSALPISNSSNLSRIFFLNPSTGYTAGDNGSILKTTNGGQNWINQNPGNFENFRGLYFIDINTGYISGSTGAIVKTTNGGINWFNLTSGVTVFLLDIIFVNSNTGFCVGTSGTILKTTNEGINWTSLQSNVTSSLFGVYALNSDTCYAYGDDGKILKTTNGGENWFQQASGSVTRFYSIKFANSTTGSAVGLDNTILRTTNAGVNWVAQQSNLTGQDFYGLSLHSPLVGTVVGSNGYILHTTTGGFSPPSVPNLTSPPNGAVNVSINPLLDWDTASLASSYCLQVSADSSFSANTIDTSGLDSSNFTVPANLLINNTRYYWRVRGQNFAGYGGWSSTWHFTTIVAIPNAPALLLPPDNSSNISLHPFFDWDSTSPAIYYRIQITGDSTFNTIDDDITGITVSKLTLTDDTLTNNTRYFWRVSGTNIAGTGNWSNPFRFSTEISIPPAPHLILPPNGAVNVSLTPLLAWREDISASGYQIQVSADSLFQNNVFDTSGVNQPFLTIPNNLLLNFTRYYWHVRTTNNLGTGNWSVTWHFTTILSVPAAPVLLLPPDGSVNVTLTPLLDWDDNPYSTYRLQVSSDPNFSSTIINIGGLALSQYAIQGGTLTNNTLYYWRVNATNAAGTGDWSMVWHFTTIVTAPVTAPVLLAPPNGSTGISGTPTLDWNNVFGASRYRVQISSDSLFSGTHLDSTLTLSNITVPGGILVSNHLYYWRVRAENEGGFSQWSVIWHFTTGPIGINVISSLIPKEFKLYNNYPNPFNPVTKIRFDIPKAGNSEMIIYDLLGREVSIVFNQYLQPGAYEVSWNGSSLASGIYIYRLVTKDNADVKKMVLVK